MNGYEELSNRNTKGKLPVTFKFEEIKNEAKSYEQNKPVYDTVPIAYVTLSIKDIVARRITKDRSGNYSDWTIDENPNQWAAFIGNFSEEAFDGTPLSQWAHPDMTQERVNALRANKIITVEHLASVTDAGLGKIGKDARRVRDAAIAFLENAKEGAGLMKAQGEIDELKAMVKSLQEQNSKLLETKATPSKSAKVVKKDKQEGD